MGKHNRILVMLIVDAMLILCSVYGAYLLRFDFSLVDRPQFIPTIPYVMGLAVILTLISFYFFKIYKRVWQYASIGDLLSIIYGALVSSGIYFIILHFGVRHFYPLFVVPRSIYPLSAMLIIFSVGGTRVVWRMIRDSYTRIQPHHRRALIVGAGSAGMMVVKELKHTHSEFYPIAFIDDDAQKFNLEILGIPVVGNCKDIPSIVVHYNIQDIIVALPSASRAEIASILDICKRTSCQIKIIPRMNDVINGKLSMNTIRNVSVEDLLGREPVKVDLDEISDYLSGQVVLVTGAGGSIGSELCRQIAGFHPKQLLLLGHGENSIYEIELELRKKFSNLQLIPLIADVQDKRRISQVFEEYRPQIVFHAAAHKHVPMMEYNPLEAIKNNVFGTKNVAECAHEFRVARFVMISTDKAVNPTNVMGATKRIAEMIVQSLDQISQTQFSAVRFGNVLGSRGSVIPIFKRQIEEGGPVTVTHPEMVRYFMTIPEAVQLVIQTGALANGGETFILDMGKPVKIADLAKDLIRLSGLEPEKDIKIKYIGIRPGEKLFEEILTNEEGTKATKHDRIFVGKSLQVPFKDITTYLEKFDSLINDQEKPQPQILKNLLKEIVPTYHWQEEAENDNAIRFKEILKSSLEMVAAIEGKST